MGFDPGKLRRINNLAKLYPRAPIGTLATLAGISPTDLGNYTTDEVGTRATNANFGNFTKTQNTEVQSTNTPRDTPGSGTAFQGGGTDVASAFDNRVEVDETAAFEAEFDAQGPVVTPTPRPENLTNTTQNTVDPGLANALRAQERAAIEASNAFEEPPAPDPYPAPPPPRPVESFDTPVDDFADYQPPVTQVDDFAEFQSPTQVDDFAEYQPPVQVDDFSELNVPPQVDDFSAYSNNNFGAQVDDFSEINTPPQVDDFADYSDNNFGAQVDDFADYQSPQQVNTFGVDDFGDNNALGQVDDFGDFNSPQQVNTFGVDDFGDNDPLGQVDDFAEYDTPSEVNPFGVDDFGDPEVAQFDEFGDPILAPEDRVDNEEPNFVDDDPTVDIGDGADGEGIDGVEQAAISQQQQAALNAQALKDKARQQQTISEMREASGVKNADGDWRVKLRLAPQATYLYKAADPGILAPLAVTDGIIFPYTPTIDVQYRAEYQNYSPTHSNYQHYFYKNSSVQTVQLQAEFTAQDTIEAEYLLACIHFLRSASKMFYGQDAERGSPPPLLYLTGLGEYQFNESPCVITEFNYNLPSDVNYIRARSRHINRDDQLQFQKPLASTTTNGNFASLNRLKTAVTNLINGGPGPSITPGAKPTKLTPGNLGTKGATYVPTKMAMTINMLPVVSRQTASQVFSLRDYANGNLLKKGLW